MDPDYFPSKYLCDYSSVVRYQIRPDRLGSEEMIATWLRSLPIEKLEELLRDSKTFKSSGANAGLKSETENERQDRCDIQSAIRVFNPILVAVIEKMNKQR